MAQGHVLSRPYHRRAATAAAACINRQALTFKRAPNVKVSIFRCQASAAVAQVSKRWNMEHLGIIVNSKYCITQ